MKGEGACVYIVDDDPSVLEATTHWVRGAGYRAIGFSSGSEFLLHPPQTPSCLIVDIEMPGLSGLELQDRLVARKDAIPIVFLTAHASIPLSVRAMRAGAIDFLTKPIDGALLLGAIGRAFAQCESRARNSDSSPPAPEVQFGIVGTSSALCGALRQVRMVAPTDTTVLIQGETGTGKESIARAVHDLSKHKSGPFVKVNCAAIPANLLESELMGHERGAFTGALSRRVGRFESAQDGSIFLDEIGEMPLDLQPKLLRILQEREFERVGGSRTHECNARVIAATNRDLKAMVNQGTFRQDLYYRLNVFPIDTPPLRERRSDIPGLAHHFIRQITERMGIEPLDISPRALEQILSYSWPGNIRELQNVIERAVIMSDGKTIEIPDFDEGPDSLVSDSDDFAEASRAHILRVLQDTDWVVGGRYGAAARLKMKRSTLNFRMKKLGIIRPGSRSHPVESRS